ncbi:MAG: hypothetical protein Q8S21_01300 [Candidatus Paracaedibacteraceae bacterium]|nr:hypothetical protein [Candidatus Paracaedibacteraceae bacterium]
MGKYTIAKELAKNYSFIICDNQLINNPIFELLQYDGYAKIPDFSWNSIAKIRTEIFKFLTKVQGNDYVLTNCLGENLRDRKLYEQVKHMAEIRGSLFIPVRLLINKPVRLLINKDEHLKRLTQPKRRERWKSIDPKDAEDKGPLLSISHPHFLEIEVSNLSPEGAAKAVMNHIIKVNSTIHTI